MTIFIEKRSRVIIELLEQTLDSSAVAMPAMH